jgi:hypothetical protein
LPFDQATRGRLEDFVARARDILTVEFTRQLQHIYGMDPTTGEVTPLERLKHLDDRTYEIARLLRETVAHYAAAQPHENSNAILRLVREQAFTVLNRLCAVRMAEARGIMLESVAAGMNSQGFQLYLQLAGVALGEAGEAYAAYLMSVFDELGHDLPALFHRYSAQGRLFPGESALLAVLEFINAPEMQPLWAEDETIGWIYQYFNSQEERRQMRAESSAPRNSRELAVRNQFFTPRYVVEFLTDNTLGRLWYDMTKGRTALAEICRYLVIEPGEQPRPVAAKDPRELRILDPACGSMHFGLYAFDLLERIYIEAWEMTVEQAFDALRAAYPNLAELRQQIPRLILEHNIHGIDIDPRAVQIAGLSLWLRAQRSWRDLGIPPGQRPTIKRTNVVCAEPMPGEANLLREFVLTLHPPVLVYLVEEMFQAMSIAGEAGSLLKVETLLRERIAEAKAQWQREGLQRPLPFGEFTPGEGGQHRGRQLDFTGIDDAGFWDGLEQRILAALRDYAQQALTAQATTRRLFAHDAAEGFAFADLCMQQYDVVLMNPPFGEFTKRAKAYAEKHYPRTKNDIFAAFVERGLGLLRKGGRLGAITSRTGFFLSSFQKWREEVLLQGARPTVVADLGYGVLDNAMVETAAYCLEVV